MDADPPNPASVNPQKKVTQRKIEIVPPPILFIGVASSIEIIQL
jgi:hypothetical protein